MKKGFFLFIAAALLLSVFVLASTTAKAQPAKPNISSDIIPTLTKDPLCLNLVNTADHTVMGTLSTDYYVRDDGIKTRHRSNFRLAAGETEGFCSTGPFYPGGSLELVLKTLIPIYSCKTMAGVGDVIIKSRKREDGTHYVWAECFVYQEGQ